MRPSWVTRQIGDFVAQFCASGGNEAWIGVQTLDGLGGAPQGGLWRQGGRLEVAPDLSLSEGFVWRPDDAARVPELWLAPEKTGYRRAFERFAVRELGASGLEGADVQIDHVFPKGAGRLGGLAYVRMLAVPPESNMAAGRTLEKAMVARNDALGPRAKPARMATYFSVGKATGFDGYDSLPDEEEGGNLGLAGALIAHLRGFGLPGDVLTDLDAMLTADRARSLR
ncbi:hypothetical protein [Neoroseomonas soli]|uniref:Uncharacterized protein n=1 Tax=Neoroseomonas soli TaxID=1081025 RepID=A0A9X9WSI4_9PROT|nr:hypothetical protein [Neoroseomonas soli]MBR0670113.1 hypothetical protein [Neoroseomonas soli]